MISYSAVAIELGLTRKMVDKHVERIHRKLGAHCVAHLVHYALANREVHLLYASAGVGAGEQCDQPAHRHSARASAGRELWTAGENGPTLYVGNERTAYMKLNSYLLAAKRGRQPHAVGRTPFRLVLLILPCITAAPAQNVLWSSPQAGVEPELGAAPLFEHATVLSTNSNSSGVSAGADVSILAKASAQEQPPPGSPAPVSAATLELKLDAGPQSIWEAGVGEGFRRTTASVGMSVGVLGGLAIFGGKEHHDLAVVSLNYGHMLGPTLGQGHWYQGNPEVRIELFSGGQWHPDTQWFVGLTPHLRYNLATGTRWIPFIDLGAGVTATGIGSPDLSGTFEFNLQGGPGIQWFIKDNLSLSAEVRYVHWSCGGITKPNDGLNGIEGVLGINYSF